MSLIPAAQYLRMSTEQQQYSLENQATAIKRYATVHGFDVVETYSDAARSGVVVKLRHGLQQLLRDVMSGASAFKAILVYDVSRWGRFQDGDEAGCYEFICKSAGIPVHYCAETFSNENSWATFIMKVLKRTMAGEYSRELGVRVFAGQKRVYEAGFRGSGGCPGYGLRRMLVGPDHRPKQLLQPGERKSLTTDRVVLVPGPADEVRCIREIYRLFTTQKHTFTSISNELNRQSIPYLRGSRWTAGSVGTILHHLKYNGTLVYGRTTRKLYQKEQKLPASRWLVVPHAFEPVVDDATFAAAQALQAKWTVHKSDDQLLGELRAILKQYGRLTSRIIRQAGGVSPASYRHRFGSLMKAYDLIGYDGPILKLVETRRRVQALRLNVMRQLELLFPDTVRIGRRGGRTRSWLNVGRRKVSVRVCLPLPKSEEQSWLLRRVPAEDKLATLVCLADHAANSVAHFFIFPVLPRSRGKNMRITLAELRSSKRLAHLREFQQAFRVVCEPQSRARRKRC